MFKMLVQQQLYNLADEELEYQVRDRLSFMRFLGLQLEDRVPDAKTVWLYREPLNRLELVEVLFQRFHAQLAADGYIAPAGRMVDAMFVVRLGSATGEKITARLRASRRLVWKPTFPIVS